MLSEALRLIRVFSDLKQVQLAERLGISNSLLSEIESGVRKPTLDLIEKYSIEFGMPASAILFFAEELPHAKAGEKIRRNIASKVIALLKFVEGQSNESTL